MPRYSKTFAASSVAWMMLATWFCNVGHVVFAQTTTDPNEINAETNALFMDLLSSALPEEPVVFRLDQLTDDLVERAMSGIEADDEQIAFVMNGLGVTNLWSEVLFDPATGEADLSVFVVAMLGLLPGNYGIDPYPGFLESRDDAKALEAQSGRNFTSEIIRNYQAVMKEYITSTEQTSDAAAAPSLEKAPVYQVSYGYVNATNAKTTGFFPEGSSAAGRCNVILNLGAKNMLRQDYFAIATLHESWHCFHSTSDVSPNTLLKVAMREGVVTYLTSVVMGADLDNKTQVADLLFWSNEELEAAENFKSDLVNEFAKVRTETDSSKYKDWMFLGIPNTSVLGAPSRSAYYVAFLAVQAYANDVLSKNLDALKTTTLAKMLLDEIDTSEGREKMFQALVEQASIPTSNPTSDRSEAGRAYETTLFLIAFLAVAGSVAAI